MSKKKSIPRKKKKVFTKNVVATLIIIVLLTGGYLYIREAEINDFKRPPVINNDHEHRELYYILENRDTANFLEYIILEKNTNILELSKIFYGNEVYWSYIYLKNNKNISNPLDIPKGTALNIPRVDSELIDQTNPATLERATVVGDSILNFIYEDSKPKLIE